jgi:hypothetical protein
VPIGAFFINLDIGPPAAFWAIAGWLAFVTS